MPPKRYRVITIGEEEYLKLKKIKEEKKLRSLREAITYLLGLKSKG